MTKIKKQVEKLKKRIGRTNRRPLTDQEKQFMRERGLKTRELRNGGLIHSIDADKQTKQLAESIITKLSPRGDDGEVIGRHINVVMPVLADDDYENSIVL